jgi:hypothetical protein
VSSGVVEPIERSPRPVSLVRAGLCAAAVAVSLLPGVSRAQPAGPLEVQLSVYGWFPGIRGQTRASQQAGGSDFTVDVGDILERLEFTFQGSADLRRDRVGLLVDLVYMSVGDSATAVRTGSVGNVAIPVGASADVNVDMKSRIWTVAGYYRAVETAQHTLDVLGGIRYLDVEQRVDWSVTGNVGAIPVPDRVGTRSASLGNVDAIVGVRGRVNAGPDGQWFVPYHVDLGAGASRLTFQALAGIGYRFAWGEAVAAWRYLKYDFASDSRIADLVLSGPVAGAQFRW